jgi:PERQ amino acid-rich with GYF domain-containing protein
MGLPASFPPPPSASPLPAPAAQRNRSHVAAALAEESGSRSQTPSVETPSATLAPWAKENLEGSKGPSLKDIQEAEAKRAAQQEEIAAAARRAQAEQERLALAARTASPAQGLPSTANWASGSPATPTGTGASAWAKPLAGKAVPPTTSNGKKTLAQIQKEEEARKNRAAAAAAAASLSASATTAAVGKRYADLASKVATPTGPIAGGAWTTVGSSGKVKGPGTPTTAAPTLVQRAVSGNVATTILAPKPKPAAPTRSNTVAVGGSQSAHDEFQKWVKASLSRGLNPSINGTISLVHHKARQHTNFPS